MKSLPVFQILFLSTLFALLACNEVHIKINTDNDTYRDSLNLEYDNYITEIEKGSATRLLTEINMTAGRIHIGTNSEKLMKGVFEFTQEDWKPKVTYIEEGTEGFLKIGPKKEQGDIHFQDSDICRYSIDLNPDIEQEIKIGIGACEGEINLEGFNLKSFELAIGAGELGINLKNTSVENLELAAGAGKLTVNLTGDWENNLTADIAGGVGEIILLLPKGPGIRAEISGLLGDIEAPGFEKNGKVYTSKNFEGATYSLKLDIAGAIGQVRLVLQE